MHVKSENKNYDPVDHEIYVVYQINVMYLMIEHSNFVSDWKGNYDDFNLVIHFEHFGKSERRADKK